MGRTTRTIGFIVSLLSITPIAANATATLSKNVGSVKAATKAKQKISAGTIGNSKTTLDKRLSDPTNLDSLQKNCDNLKGIVPCVKK